MGGVIVAKMREINRERKIPLSYSGRRVDVVVLLDSKKKAAVQVESAEEISPLIGQGLKVSEAKKLAEAVSDYLYLRYDERNYSLADFDFEEFVQYQANPYFWEYDPDPDESWQTMAVCEMGNGCDGCPRNGCKTALSPCGI